MSTKAKLLQRAKTTMKIVENAERELKAAREERSDTRIKDAEKALQEAQAANHAVWVEIHAFPFSPEDN